VETNVASRWTRIGVAVLLAIAAGASLRQIAAKRYRSAVAAARVQAKQRLNSERVSAIRHGSAESARQCLVRGADPNAHVAPNGATALVLAAHRGHEELATLLLDQGADPNARGQIVIPDGVDLDQLDLTHEVTPLIEAVWTLNAPVARLLLARGLILTQQTARG
jgi:ankyrin repeat protein